MRLSMLAAAVIGAAFLFGNATESQAQIRFGIGFGSGYGGFYPGGYGGFGGYPYGYGGYGGYGGFGGYPSYVPRSYNYGNNYTRTVVVQPKQVGDGQPIKIFSLDDAGTPLTYTLNGTEYTLKPGESQLLVYDRNWTLAFDRGGDFGTGEYSLTSGQYWFELTSDRGWELYHDADVSKLTKQSAPAVDTNTKKNALPPKAF